MFRKLLPFCMFIMFCCSSQLPAQTVDQEKTRAKWMLKTVSSDLEKNFYDAQMHGLDWKALYAQTQERIEKAQTVNQVYLAIFSMVDKLDDSHTMFLPPSRAARPVFGFKAKAYGENVYIYDVKKKGAAEGAGLKKGDCILKVNNFSAERKSFDKMMLFYHILQPASRLVMVVQRGGEDPKTITLDAKIKSEQQHLDLRDDLNIWDILISLENDEDENKSEYFEPDKDGIGMLKLTSFEYSNDQMSGMIGAVDKSKGLIIDLRGNPGGYQDAVAALAGQFATAPDVMADVISRKKTEPIKIKPSRRPFLGPIAVLIDSDSASAAEMFAKHVQLKKKGMVIGDKTLGRVTSSLFYSEQIGADTIVPFGVQIAVGRVVFPDKEELEKKGVTPDQSCIPTQEQITQGKDHCLDVAREYLLNAIKSAPQSPGASKSN